MKNKVSYIQVSGSEICCLRDMWLELNNYHIPVVTSFNSRFLNVSFEKHYQNLIQYKNLFAYIAVLNRVKIGFVIVFGEGDIAEIDSIYVKDKYRRNGIGDTLMKYALKELVGVYKEIVIRVAEGNIQSFHFRNHFKKRYTLFQYDYSDNVDETIP